MDRETSGAKEGRQGTFAAVYEDKTQINTSISQHDGCVLKKNSLINIGYYVDDFGHLLFGVPFV